MQRREREPRITWLDVIILLVVIAVLIWVLFPVTSGPHSHRIKQRSEASTAVPNIVHALKLFHADYGHFPEIEKPRADGKIVICVGDPACKMSENTNGVLFDVLRAIPRGPNANHALNPRQQKYFEMGKARDPKNPRSGFADGREFSAKDQGCLFDPWGFQYCIVFTTDGSGTFDLGAVYSDLAGPQNLIRVPVAAFSLGNDGRPGGKGYEGKYRKPSSSEPPDDIVSWQ